jgi:hypothetical protein
MIFRRFFCILLLSAAFNLEAAEILKCDELNLSDPGVQNFVKNKTLFVFIKESDLNFQPREKLKTLKLKLAFYKGINKYLKQYYDSNFFHFKITGNETRVMNCNSQNIYLLFFPIKNLSLISVEKNASTDSFESNNLETINLNSPDFSFEEFK